MLPRALGDREEATRLQLEAETKEGVKERNGDRRSFRPPDPAAVGVCVCPPNIRPHPPPLCIKHASSQRPTPLQLRSMAAFLKTTIRVDTDEQTKQCNVVLPPFLERLQSLTGLTGTGTRVSIPHRAAEKEEARRRARSSQHVCSAIVFFPLPLQSVDSKSRMIKDCPPTV